MHTCVTSTHHHFLLRVTREAPYVSVDSEVSFGCYRTHVPFRKNILKKSASNMHAENTLDNSWLGHCLALDKFGQTASSSQTAASSLGECEVKWSCSSVSDSLRPPWTVAYQAPQSMKFSRQEYWSGLPFPASGDLAHLGSNPGLPCCRQRLHHLSRQGSPKPSRLGSCEE